MSQTLTIELPDEIADRIVAMPEAERTQIAIEAFSTAFNEVDDLLLRPITSLSPEELSRRFALEAQEIKEWWDGLTEAEREEENRIIEVSRNSKFSPAEEVYARIRVKYAHLSEENGVA